MFQVSDAWKAVDANAHMGVLVMRNMINPPRAQTEMLQVFGS